MRNVKAVGPCAAGTVEQRMDNHIFCTGRRALHPKCGEIWKLFAHWIGCFNG